MIVRRMIPRGTEKQNASRPDGYRTISEGNCTNKSLNNIWKSKVPMKIKVFLWQLFNNKLQAAKVLKKRGWKVSEKCCLYGKQENIDHIFITCPITSLAWCILREVFNWTSHPISRLDFMGSWINVRLHTPQTSMFLFTGLAWAIWARRNKMVIEKVFPSKPSDVIFSTLSFFAEVVYPEFLIKPKDKEGTGKIMEIIYGWMKNFKPPNLVIYYASYISEL